MRRACALVALAALSLLLGTAGAARAAYVQLGPKLAPFDVPAWTGFGEDVALSADGLTALVGSTQTVWALVRQPGGPWVEQGPTLPFDDPLLPVGIGLATALSADGDTALVAGSFDEGGTPRDAVWTFTRTNGVWAQDGAPLTVTDAAPTAPYDRRGFGASLSLSADGQTLLVGGVSGTVGAAWPFVRQNGAWVQQGPTLRAPAPSSSGPVVSLSRDGGTALLGTWDSLTQTATVEIVRRTGGRWSPDGPALVPTGGKTSGSGALDADGSTALIAGWVGDRAALWTFDRSGGQWSQAGPPSFVGDASSVWSTPSLSADGESVLIGGVGDTGSSRHGASWLMRRSGADWVLEARLEPSDAVENSTPIPSVGFGSAVAITPDADTLLIGGSEDNDQGAVWTFGAAAAPLVVPRMRAFAGTTIALGPIAAGVVLDRGNHPTGSVSFRVYGPESDCVGPPLQTATVPVNGNGDYFATGLTATALGIYAVSAHYTGDGRNAPLATSCRDAQFEVLNGLELAVDVRGSLEVGAPLTIAPALAGGTAPTGDVTVSVFGASDPRCVEAPVFSQNATVHDGHIPAVSYTPSGTGRLRVTVFYGGDGQNPAVAVGCGDAVVDVGRASPAIAATASPPVAVGGAIGAAARVAGYRAGGILTFLLFGPGDATCARRPLATVDAPLTDGVAQSEALATRAVGTYHLTAVYPGDRYNGPVESSCAAGAVTVAKSRPVLVAAASSPARGTLVDGVELRGGFHPHGNVRFDLYGRRDPRCRRAPVLTILAPLGDDGRATTTPLDGAAAGRYQFVVRYGGDAANEAARSVCGANPVRVSGSARDRPHRARERRRRHRRRAVRAAGRTPRRG